MTERGGANPKTELVAFCQRKIGRSMLKDDIVYTTEKFDEQFQSTVKLNCYENQSFAGELCDSEKEAQKSAADQALQGLEEDIKALKLPQKRSSAGGGEPGAKSARVSGDGDEPPSIAVKSRLHTCVTQLMGRELGEGDIVYEVATLEDGSQQATLKAPRLSGKLGRTTWTGDAYMNKRDTKLSAADKAVEAILADPTAAAKIDMSQAKIPAEGAKRNKGPSSAKFMDKVKGSGKGKGKGGGFGKGGGKGGGKAAMAQMMNQMMEMMWYMKGKGKGKGGKGKDW